MDEFVKITLGQLFVKDCAVGFIWSCIPYRGEWRYHKTMLLDAGICARTSILHVKQLAVEPVRLQLIIRNTQMNT